MVLDDDRDAVLTLKTIMGEDGHEVWGVYRAGDVKLGVQHFDPDVVLLDPMAAGMRSLRKYARSAAIGVRCSSA